MSTENEGAAVPPEGEPPVAPQAADRAPEPGGKAPQVPGTPPSTEPSLDKGGPGREMPARPDFAPGAPQHAPQQGDTAALPPVPHSAPTPFAADPAQPQAQAGEFGPYGAPTGPAGHAPTATWQTAPGGYAGGPGAPADPWGAPEPAPRRRRGGLVAAVLVAALVAGGVGGGIGYWAAGQGDQGSTTVSSASDPGAVNRKPNSVSGIAQKALPSVVTIEAQGSGGEGGTGTGFVYDKQGHILTNNHVVASAAQGGKLTATFSNGKKYAAQVVGRAEGYDVAVIKLKNPSGATLNPLPLGRSGNVQVGDATIAIGAPFGLSGTVTTGIISAKDRPVASSDGGGSNASYMSALQTDASINPGNSGGPLLDAAGNVIGINSAIQSAGGGGGGFGGESGQAGSIGLGFAIPIDQATRVAQDLIKTGQPVYPRIGVQVTMKEGGGGATIPQTGEDGANPVTAGGPAAHAGLKPGDVITKLDDTPIDSGPTLISEIWQHKPGDTVTLTYKRGGQEHTTKVTLQAHKGDD
ncbi:trypsin-like peptidase domain-containing protein [Streptomyces sp. NPDC059740]|uniref:S1C family serine protease n=1 Tax=Streptomyces sp. NPDC059740 TaxID=3346926 RepID=UPI00366026D4